MKTRVQPFPAPSTPARLAALVDSGALVDLTGAVLSRRECRCGGTHLGGEPCHRAVTCPVCQSTAPSCKKPSGHEATDWHTARWTRYEEVVTALVDAGT